MPSDAPTISPSGSALTLSRGPHAASANGTPRKAASSSRLFIASPLGLVVAHQRLVVQTVYLDGHGAEVCREREHGGERLVVQKFKLDGGRARRDVERLAAREREAPDAEGGDGGVVGAHGEARGFERADDAPVGVAREQGRGRLHADGRAGREALSEEAVEARRVELAEREGVRVGE